MSISIRAYQQAIEKPQLSGSLWAGSGLFTIFSGYDAQHSVPAFRVELNYDAQAVMQGGHSYKIRALIRNDDGQETATSWIPLDDFSIYAAEIEIVWRAASGSGANDGSLSLWVNGGQQTEIQNVDNDTLSLDFVRWRLVSGTADTVRGSLYFDSFASSRTIFEVVRTIQYTYDPLRAASPQGATA